MTIKPTPYYIASLLLSLTSCFAFVLSAVQLYGDEDYVHNYLGCGPDGDTGAIPVMGSVMVSLFFGAVHIIAHVIFITITRTKTFDNNFKVRFGFYNDEKMAAWIVKPIFYLFSIFLIYDYISTFYKFYLFEFLSFVIMTITVVIYGLTISNLIGTKKEHTELKLSDT